MWNDEDLMRREIEVMRQMTNAQRHPDKEALNRRPDEEIRVVDPLTGGAKGQKLARFDLMPPEFEWALSELYGVGTRKYADRNWEKGYAWGLSYGALRRHLTQWVLGEDTDPETGVHHLIAVAWHAAALYTFQRRGIGTDDLTARRRMNPSSLPPETPGSAPGSLRPAGLKGSL